MKAHSKLMALTITCCVAYIIFVRLNYEPSTPAYQFMTPISWLGAICTAALFLRFLTPGNIMHFAYWVRTRRQQRHAGYIIVPLMGFVWWMIPSDDVSMRYMLIPMIICLLLGIVVWIINHFPFVRGYRRTTTR